MQTFLPYPDPVRCASVLDDKRLYKQIVECKQILNTLEAKRLRREEPNNLKGFKGIAWANHPAVLMWENNPKYLRIYQLCMLDEWLLRRWGVCLGDDYFTGYVPKPSWFTNEEIFKSHRANLYRKDPKHYAQFKGDDEGQGYVWAVTKEDLKEIGG